MHVYRNTRLSIVPGAPTVAHGRCYSSNPIGGLAEGDDRAAASGSQTDGWEGQLGGGRGRGEVIGGTVAGARGEKGGVQCNNGQEESNIRGTWTSHAGYWLRRSGDRSYLQLCRQWYEPSRRALSHGWTRTTHYLCRLGLDWLLGVQLLPALAEDAVWGGARSQPSSGEDRGARPDPKRMSGRLVASPPPLPEEAVSVSQDTHRAANCVPRMGRLSGFTQAWSQQERG